MQVHHTESQVGGVLTEAHLSPDFYNLFQKIQNEVDHARKKKKLVI